MRKIFHTLFFILITGFPAFAQTVVLNENFSGGLPTGWSNTANASGNTSIWSFNNPGNRTFSSPISGSFMILDSDELGSGNTQNTTVSSTSFDASSYASLQLSFDHQYREYISGESCEVEVYNGSSWVSVFLWENGDGNYPAIASESIDITTAISGASNAQIRFTFIATWGYWWAVDNVKIEGTAPVATVYPLGPGGVGSTDASSKLVAWYTPESVRNSSNTLPTDGQTVSKWLDVSGNGNDLTNSGNVTYQSGSSDLINGHAKITATTLNRQFRTSSNVSGNTIIVVNNPGSGNSFEAVAGFNGDKGIRRPSSGNSTYWQAPGSGGGTNNDTWSTTTGKSYVNGSTSTSYSHSDQLHFVSQERPSNYTSTFYIGGYYPGRYFTGEVAEVMVFNSALTTIEKIIIDNYLSAKYGITLASNDIFTQDNSGNGNFDYHVSGIGMNADGSSLSSSQGTGIIKIGNPAHLAANEYLLWGENQDTDNHNFSTASDYMERQNSTWKVSRSGNPGRVTLEVNASDLDLVAKPSCAPLYLIVSNDANFSSKTRYEMTLSAGVYSATNVLLKNNRYFTFEYQDQIVVDGTNYLNGGGVNGSPSTVDGCYKLLVKSNASAALTLNEDAQVREIEIQSGGVFNVNTGISLTTDGPITNNGTINIDEGGSLVQTMSGIDNNSGSGIYNVKRDGNNSAYVYNIWSSPVEDATITDIFPGANACAIFVFDRLTQSWKYDYPQGYSTTCYGNGVTFGTNDVITGGDGNMDIARGYFAPGNSVVTKTYSGKVNNGEITTPISTTNLINPGGTNWGDDDWNLIGNPYPSAINAASFWAENAVNNNRIVDALYFWDEADTTGGYNEDQDYASWNMAGGVNSGNTSEIPQGHIASGQGFWVVANTNSNVVFNNSMRTSSNSQFFKTVQPKDQHNAWISFSSPSNFTNNILVGFNTMTTDSFDLGYDAHKLVGNGHVRFASLNDSDEFVIQSIANMDVNETKSIPLVVTSDETGSHTFSNYLRKNLDPAFEIYLRDNVLNVNHDLSQGDYQVQLDANVEYTARFELIYVNKLSDQGNGNSSKDSGNPNGNPTTGIDEEKVSNTFMISQTESSIQLTAKSEFNGDIVILDVTGKKFYSKTSIQYTDHLEISKQNLSFGLYLLKYTPENGAVTTKKIVIQ